MPLPWTSVRAVAGLRAGAGVAAAAGAWSELSVEAQEGDPDSMLALYRAALRLRRSSPALGAGRSDLRWLDLGDDVVAFSREPGFTFVLNLGASRGAAAGRGAAGERPLADGQLPVDTAVWLSRG